MFHEGLEASHIVCMASSPLLSLTEFCQDLQCLHALDKVEPRVAYRPVVGHLQNEKAASLARDKYQFERSLCGLQGRAKEGLEVLDT